MKEKLYTIPVNDAVSADDECPICNAKRSLERDAIDYAIGPGASYMESDIREMTDKVGFCAHHFQMMYEYGNSLGNALILSSHIRKVAADLRKEMSGYKGVKQESGVSGESNEHDGVGETAGSGNETAGGGSGNGGIMKWLRSSKGATKNSNVENYINGLTGKCFVCDYYRDTYRRYIATFFYLYENDEAFRDKIKNGKGFCLPHMSELLHSAPSHLKGNMLDDFTKTLFDVMDRNLERIEGDISWFVEKFKHENRNADWKQSKDAIPRTIQKLAGGYPADGPYKPQ